MAPTVAFGLFLGGAHGAVFLTQDNTMAFLRPERLYVKNSKLLGAAIFAIVFQSCGNNAQKSSSAEADTVKEDTPKTITSNLVVNSGGSDFNLVVGHRIHVEEGFVDSDPASGLAM